MALTFPDEQPFASGAMVYQRAPATAHETTPRIILRVAIEGVVTEAMVDTGGIYLVCNPHVATQMRLDARDAVSGLLSTLLRGVLVQGRLYRVTLTLLAVENEDFTIQSTAFVPEGEDEESWGELPCILGFQDCLERFRFALDPNTDTFYFGLLP